MDVAKYAPPYLASRSLACSPFVFCFRGVPFSSIKSWSCFELKIWGSSKEMNMKKGNWNNLTNSLVITWKSNENNLPEPSFKSIFLGNILRGRRLLAFILNCSYLNRNSISVGIRKWFIEEYESAIEKCMSSSSTSTSNSNSMNEKRRWRGERKSRRRCTHVGVSLLSTHNNTAFSYSFTIYNEDLGKPKNFWVHAILPRFSSFIHLLKTIFIQVILVHKFLWARVILKDYF